MQIQSQIPIVKYIEDLLLSFYSFFSHSPKMHIEFFKLVDLMKTKGSKNLRNVKTCWVSMLSAAKQVMLIYMLLIAKMVEDNASLWLPTLTLLWCEFIHISFLYATYVGNSPWTNQIHTEARHFCLWLCCSHQNLSTIILFSLFRSCHKIYMSLMFSTNSNTWLFVVTT